MTTAVSKSDAPKPVRLAWAIKELALAMGSNYWTVRREITKHKRIKAFQLGGEYRISVFEVARVLEVPVADLEQLLADMQARQEKAA